MQNNPFISELKYFQQMAAHTCFLGFVNSTQQNKTVQPTKTTPESKNILPSRH
jgi:hypothetical protein